MNNATSRPLTIKLELQNVRFNTANKLIANRQIQLPYTEKHVICSYFNSRVLRRCEVHN